MPLKLVEPRKGKSPNYTIRGTHLGVRVNRTAGTADRATARKALRRIREEIEAGTFAPRKGLTFAAAALSYIRAGGESRYILPLNDHFGDTIFDEIDQAAIDEAAVTLYPEASPATRNRQVYTPLSAIMKHAGIKTALRRPKGAQGRMLMDWLWPEEAAKLLDAAGFFDPEFRLMLLTIVYTGLRISEAMRLRVDGLNLSEAIAFLEITKNEDPRPVHLPPIVVAELAGHPRGLERSGETVFKFRRGGHLYALMAASRSRASLSKDVTFHTLRHTWATWMRRYGGLDIKGLVSTGAWRDEKSAARYAHVVVTEEARRADLLPAPTRGKVVENGN